MKWITVVASFVLVRSCVEEAGWEDEDGYDCGWYTASGKGRCAKYGHKYENDGLVANQACCGCQTSGGNENCEVDSDWVHPKWNDNCEDYISGTSQKYNCDDLPKEKCCTCGATVVKQSDCVDKKVGDRPWHDSYGESYNCAYYSSNNRCSKEGHKYPEDGMDANDACCTCGGGEAGTGAACVDMEGEGGGKWYDSYGPKYNCGYYESKNRCGPDGDKYADQYGITANTACCTCGGGVSGGEESGDELWGNGSPEINDNVGSVVLGSVEFKHKKSLQGGFVLYWSVDQYEKTIQMGLLSPAGKTEGWISVGISPTGTMAGSDAIVGWFDEDDEAVVQDAFLQSTSIAGIKYEDRQDLADTQMFKLGSRIGMTFTRPWDPDAGGVEVRALTDFATIIYAHGQISNKCLPTGFCNHEQDDRYIAELALTAPKGLSVYTLNRGNLDEPCDGEAALECQEGLYCYHADAIDLDYWEQDLTKYGTCQNPQVDLDDDWDAELPGIQTVFPNNGGFEVVKDLRGGFVLLYTVYKESEPGSFGPNDTIEVAVVSTNPQLQGWISFGWSPNGEMKGSDVVLGWYDDDDNNFIGDYFLTDQISNKNQVADKQELLNARVIKKNGQVALTFQRKLTPADSVQILEGLVHVIYASGPMGDVDDLEYIPYHRFRQASDIEFVPIAGDLLDANSVGLREICGGMANIACGTGLTCNLFDPAMIERMMSRSKNTSSSTSGGWGSAEATNTSGFTSASSWRHGARGSNEKNEDGTAKKSSWAEMFSNTSKLIGAGMCMRPEDQGAWDSWADTAAAAGVDSIRNAGYLRQFKLRWGFELLWDLYDEDGYVLTVEETDAEPEKAYSIKCSLVASIGPGWLGFGLGTEGAMLGANAVIGWVDNGDTSNTMIKEYYLSEKLPWEIKSIEETGLEGMELTNIEIITQGHESALTFERPIAPSNGMAPITVAGDTTVIYAVGNTPKVNDDYFGYHRFRESSKVNFFL